MPAGINSGDLDREIVLQTAPMVQNENGELVPDWDQATSQTLWAEWVPTASSEVFKDRGRLGSYIAGLFNIYDVDPRPLTHNTRILFDGRIFDVLPYQEIGQLGEGLAIPVIARDETRG
jgi:head-tail adaptor